jgi:type IV pilus assembly protein PilB
VYDDAWDQAALVQAIDGGPADDESVDSEPTPVAAEDGAADPTAAFGRRRLGEILVQQGALSEEQLSVALANQRAAASQGQRQRLGTILIQQGEISDRQIAHALASAFSIPLIDLGIEPPDSVAAKLLPRPLAERHLALPLHREGRRLTVAFADPTNVVALDDVKAYSGFTDIEMVVAAEGQLRDQLARIWSLSEDATAVADMLEGLEESQDFNDEVNQGIGFADAPTVKLINVILADAVRARASDIHIEPERAAVRVRYRIDGLLRDVMTAPRSAAAGLVSRIKVMSNLDIAERRLPQDGRARLQVDQSAIDVRISTLPSLLGEKVVIRLLSRADNIPVITQLGFDQNQLETVLGTVVAPQGLVLITGPTGSGKTGTLYSAISQIKTPDRNIITLEDPVEMQVTGITQVQVNERTGLTFTRGLRSVLRQDPDVVLVGEVRDAETAQLALEASLTGHMVMTTLHTNSAPAAVTRLVDMGVEPFLVASSLSLVVAQRLVRRVCESCAAPYTPPERVMSALGIESSNLERATPRRGTGCGDCGGTGYHGRTGVFEVLPITAALRAVLMATPNEGAVAAAARAAGMQTLRANAVAKAQAGITTYEEVLRVTQVESAGGGLHCVACGGMLADDMVVCPWCSTVVDRGHCQSCDRALDAGWRTCPWCREPVAGAAAAGATAAAGAGAVPTPVEPESPPLPRLLLVDDDPSLRDSVTAAVDGVLDVDAVGTASEGLDRADIDRYDAVLINHRLPDLTGVELIRLLRSEPRTASLPLMLVTDDSAESIESEARAAGAEDYLVKPVDPALLEQRLLALVSRSGRVPA